MSKVTKKTTQIIVRAQKGALDFEYFVEYAAHNFKHLPAYMIEAARRHTEANHEILTAIKYCIENGSEQPTTTAQILKDLSRRSTEPSTKQHRQTNSSNGR